MVSERNNKLPEACSHRRQSNNTQPLQERHGGEWRAAVEAPWSRSKSNSMHVTIEAIDRSIVCVYSGIDIMAYRSKLQGSYLGKRILVQNSCRLLREKSTFSLFFDRSIDSLSIVNAHVPRAKHMELALTLVKHESMTSAKFKPAWPLPAIHQLVPS